MNMKKHFILLFIILISKFISAQCLSGDCENGFGMFKYKSENTFEGYFKDAKIHDLGIFYFKNGATIWGAIRDQKFNGFGAVYFKNGSSYFGNLKNGLQHGLGVLYDQKKNPHSAGMWESGKLINSLSANQTGNQDNCAGNCENGYGKLKLSDTTFVQGIFQNNEAVFGTIQTKEYAYYGPIKKNLSNGIGIIEYYNAKKHLGYFKEGKKQGAGIYMEGITLKTIGVWENDVHIDLEKYQFNEKRFCNELTDICDMTSSELKSMQVQQKELFGNLWKYKFLNRFNIYHDKINQTTEIIFINFSDTEGVNSKNITELLNKCTKIKKGDNNTFECNEVAINLLDKDNTIILQLTYPIKI